MFCILVHFSQLVLVFVFFVGILLGFFLASFGLLLLGLLGFSSAGKCEDVVGGILTAFLQLEGDEVHHQPGLEDTEGNEGRDAENKGVEGATLPVDDLFFCGNNLRKLSLS